MSNSFSDQYKHPSWQKRRLERLDLSGFQCECCGDDQNQLHVHHRRYFKGRKVWEYDDSDLSVLCECCHTATHDFMDDINDSMAKFDISTIGSISGILNRLASVDDLEVLKNVLSDIEMSLLNTEDNDLESVSDAAISRAIEIFYGKDKNA